MNTQPLKVRRTVDKEYVLPHQVVYEIIHRYINAEFSELGPNRGVAGEIPEGVDIWSKRSECLKECVKRTRLRFINKFVK